MRSSCTILVTGEIDTRAELALLVRDGGLVRACQAIALATLEQLEAHATIRELKARTCRIMGNLLQFEDIPEALRWVERGVAILGATAVSEEAARLQLLHGDLQWKLGNYQAARVAIEQGLKLLPTNLRQLQLIGSITLGMLAYQQGELAQAEEETLQALNLARQLGDSVRMITAWNNLGLIRAAYGDWAGEAANYREAQALAERLGDSIKLTQIAFNMGLVELNTGNDQQALQGLQQSLALARAYGLREYELFSCSALADLHLRRGEPEQAIPFLEAANILIEATGIHSRQVELHCRCSEVALAQGDHPAALAIAKRAVDLAHELEDPYDQGVSLRAYGQALMADGQIEQAFTAFAASLENLRDLDVYEAARTQAAWSSALTKSDPIQASVLIEQARATFSKLGAKRDLAAIGRMG